MIDPRFQKGGPVPSSIGACADLYAEVRQTRLAIEKVAEEWHARETELYNLILGHLNESVDTGASGQNYRVQRVEKDRIQVKDWPSFWAFIQQTGSFEMLQKRASDTAVAEWVETRGAPPPGVEQVKVPTLSFTKV